MHVDSESNLAECHINYGIYKADQISLSTEGNNSDTMQKDAHVALG